MAIVKTTAAALLLTLVLCALLGCASFVAAQKKDYEIVSTIVEDDSDVVVVRRNQVVFMLYDETIIGAEFDDPDLRLQAAYPGFAIMQSAAYMDRKFEKAAQIGLGIGTVPSFLRHMQIPTDVIEISDAVVRQAANYFHYERCEAEDPEECVNGETFVADGLAFLQQTPEKPVYDLFIIDVYTGWNPVVFYVQEVMQNVRDNWLRGPKGVFVVNFVGFFNGPHAVVPKSILRTLQSVFKHVKVFREMDNLHDEDASNIVFFASNEPFKFTVPAHGDYKDPIYNTYFYIVANFPKWEIFTDMDASVEVGVQQAVGAEEVTFETAKDESALSPTAAATSAKARVLTQAEHGQNEFQDTHAFTQEHMRGRVVKQFPQSFWDDVKEKRRAKKTTSEKSSSPTETKEEL
ncbi:hypothetical protein Gpo141_00011238 [Globisporangium polare]